MDTIFNFAVVYFAVAGGLSSATEWRCGLDIEVSYPSAGGRYPTVACTNQCPDGEDGFSITGVAYKRFPELDSYNSMVRVSYEGTTTSCSLVPLLTEEELTALYGSCVEDDITTTAPAETTTVIDTTAAPAETTTVIDTTAAPAETTTVIDTTAAPAETTTVIDTTAAPAETTTVIDTTAAPAETTTVIDTTAAPPETTTVIDSTTAPPETTTILMETTPAASTEAPVAIRDRCRDGFSRLGGSCYLVTPLASSAQEGWRTCTQYGGAAAVIETEEEQNRLAGVLSTRVWLGVSDEEEEGHFRAPGLADVLFTRWNGGEPNNFNGNEDCVMLIPEWNFGWNDDNCQVSSRALCEHAPVPVYEEPTCPPSQHQFEDSCYFLTDVGDYDAGESSCRSAGGYPAVVTSRSEHLFLAGVATEAVYLGYTDRAEESVFVTEFGVPLYTSWSYGEPNNWNGDEDCVQMIEGWGDTWYDISCSTPLRMVCEIPA